MAHESYKIAEMVNFPCSLDKIGPKLLLFYKTFSNKICLPTSQWSHTSSRCKFLENASRP